LRQKCQSNHCPSLVAALTTKNLKPQLPTWRKPPHIRVATQQLLLPHCTSADAPDTASLTAAALHWRACFPAAAVLITPSLLCYITRYVTITLCHHLHKPGSHTQTQAV
jgi:hypothetical protein